MRSREENMRGMMGESRGGGRDMMRSNSDLMGRGDMIRNEMMGNMQVRMEHTFESIKSINVLKKLQHPSINLWCFS